MTRLTLAGSITAPGGRVTIGFGNGGSAVIGQCGAWVEDDAPAAERFVEAYRSAWGDAEPDESEPTPEPGP